MSDNANLLHVNDDNFETEVLNSDVPVLVDFWAPWCAPCKIVGPIVEAIAKEYSGRVRVAKVNTDENPNRAGSLGIRGIPTLIIFKDGGEAERIVGAVPKQMLTEMIEKVLD